MGIVTFETVVPNAVPPAKMFKAYALDGGNLVPKILPNIVNKIVNLEGDGVTPGSIREFSFGQGSELMTAKQRVEAVDEKNCTYAYSIIEGNDLAGKLEKISNEIKFEPTQEGGSVFKGTSRYYTLENVEIKEEEIKELREKTYATFTTIFKAIEAYVLANPDAYN